MWVVDRTGLEISNGPFAGMTYPKEAVGRASNLGAKLLGSYEYELGQIIEELIAEQFNTILNVGAGEGYYAVGFAGRCPESVVIAYEIDRGQRRLCRRLALANGVSNRVRLRGACRLEEIDGKDVGRLLVLCDCEGCELALLRPDRYPLLRTSTLLVELHDSVDPTLSRQILTRFDGTHDVEVIFAEERDATKYGDLAGMPKAVAQLVTFERNPPASWGLFRPRLGEP